MNFFVRRRCGTTLIELLVVIGIMGILLSLLLPAYADGTGKCRRDGLQEQRAAAPVCHAQLRPARSSGCRRPNRWTVDLLPYLEERPLANALKGWTR